MGPSLVKILLAIPGGVAGCNPDNALESGDVEVVDSPDASNGAPEEAGSVDDSDSGEGEGRLPEGPGSEGGDVAERWLSTPEPIKDMHIVGEDLFILGQNNLFQCPLPSREEDPRCSVLADFSEKPMPEEAPADVAYNHFTSLSPAFGLVTGTAGPSAYPVLTVIHWPSHTVTDGDIFPFGTLQTGQGPLPLNINTPYGAILLGTKLLVATQNRNMDAQEEYAGGTIVYPTWIGDGTLARGESGLALPILPIGGRSPTLFAEGEGGVWLLHHRANPIEGREIASGFDFIQTNEGGMIEIDEERRIEVENEGPLEVYNELALSPDRSHALVAGANRLFLVDLEGGGTVDIVTVPNGNVKAIQWYHGEERDAGFLVVQEKAEGGLYVVRIDLESSRFGNISNPLKLIGNQAGPSVLLQASGGNCFFMPSVLQGGETHVSAISCSLLKQL